jgi:hypothetical protein
MSVKIRCGRVYSRACRQIIISQIIFAIIQVDNWIVVARSVSDEAIQRLGSPRRQKRVAVIIFLSFRAPQG